MNISPVISSGANQPQHAYALDNVIKNVRLMTGYHILNQILMRSQDLLILSPSRSKKTLMYYIIILCNTIFQVFLHHPPSKWLNHQPLQQNPHHVDSEEPPCLQEFHYLKACGGTR